MFIGIAAGVLFVLIFGLIGAVMLVIYFRGKKKAEESQNWSSAPGRVTKSFLRKAESVDNDGYLTISYYPEVRYAYECLGQTYNGHRIAFGGSVGNSNPQKAYETLARYPVGQNVVVYYNPNIPEEATLERRSGEKVMLIIGVIFSLVALCTLVAGGIVAIVVLTGLQ